MTDSTVFLQIRLKKEQEEKEHKKKEKAEAHLYTIIKVWSCFSHTSFSLLVTFLDRSLFVKNEHRLLEMKI
jgi:hypothetical protein